MPSIRTNLRSGRPRANDGCLALITGLCAGLLCASSAFRKHSGCRSRPRTAMRLSLCSVFTRNPLRGTGAINSMLILPLMVSAFVMAFALSSPTFRWLGCLALVPLFVAIVRCAPAGAALSGAMWGACLHLFATCVLDTGISPGLGSLLILSAIPAAYALIGALLTRWIGFSPLVLGVGWMGVELGLSLLGIGSGLLASAQADTTLMHWVDGAFGYVVAAFIVAYINAVVLSLFGRVRLGLSRACPMSGSRPQGRTIVAQTFSGFPLFAIPSSEPRGPPGIMLFGINLRQGGQEPRVGF